MDYLAVKHVHMAIALLSITLFYIRSFSRIGKGVVAKNKLISISSVIADPLLLVSAITLMFIGGINPFEQHWLLEKIVLVIMYIVLGVKSIKLTNTMKKLAFLILNTAVILAIGYLAVSKTAFIL
ncbi:SirB2 family protein [Pseudoalteromonas sp. MMG010]|uniref:SirB2 family protein n=1 Tax=Pseudoalteromonas sp. MMG010 TaxID=2822685 RepID=UPI001B3A6334|nr:SirB2 family protein [Pseudoalteromonas sp. MMG010]MBQ4834529.1 SirB2 family protein [Pseudoalteromonas sp. MMG010]